MAKKQPRLIYDGFTWKEGNKWKYCIYNSYYKKLRMDLDYFLYVNGYKISDTKVVERRGRLVKMRFLAKNSRNSEVYYVPRNVEDGN